MSFYINSLIIKVASRCNLNCTYCYMYNKGDNSYLNQPKFMSSKVVSSIVDESYTHCIKHNLKKFNFIFHGGEPLLVDREFYTNFIEEAKKKYLNTEIELNFTLQTNGTLLTKEWGDFLHKNNIGIGISLDGTERINDEARKYHDGRGSYNDVIVGLKNVLNSYHLKIPPTILVVVNPNYNPKEILNHFISLGLKRVDFLLPDYNYVEKPLSPTYGDFIKSETPYGDWVIELYKLWKNLDADIRPVIRTFQDVIWKFLGGTIDCDVLGNDFNRALVIETDGGIEAVDSLKICGESFTKENASILREGIDSAINLPLAKQYFESHKKLCDTCTNCQISELCGGGFIAHRYKKSNQFNNPSVYCKDYRKFLSYIQNDLIDSLPIEFIKESNLKRVNYADLIQDECTK